MLSPVFKRFGLLAATALTAVTLVACGGGGSDAALQQVASDTTLAVNSTVAGAVRGVDFNYSSGVAALGTTGATNVKFTSSGANPAFSITSGGNTATGDSSFGSCIFRVTNSSFSPGNPLAVGQTVTVDPCSLSVRTTGAIANGQPTSRSVALLLGAASSAGATVTVAVTAAGALTLNGAAVATVQLVPVPVTGTGSR